MDNVYRNFIENSITDNLLRKYMECKEAIISNIERFESEAGYSYDEGFQVYKDFYDTFSTAPCNIVYGQYLDPKEISKLKFYIHQFNKMLEKHNKRES